MEGAAFGLASDEVQSVLEQASQRLGRRTGFSAGQPSNGAKGMGTNFVNPRSTAACDILFCILFCITVTFLRQALFNIFNSHRTCSPWNNCLFVCL